MRTKLRSKISLLFVAFAVLVAIPAVALADTLNVNDVVTGGNTTKAPNSSGQASVYLEPQDPNDLVNGCNATGSSPATISLAATLNGQATTLVTFPNGNSKQVTGCGAATAQQIDYHVSSSAQNGQVITITGTASGGKSGSTYTSDNFTITVQQQNQAPKTPGAINSDESVNNDGTFMLSWGASTDPDGDSVTYTLEQKDNDDLNWSNVASGLTSASYTFGANNPEPEGTWDFQVKAVDSKGASSAYSTALDLVNVDKTNPNAPTLSFATTAQSPKATVNNVDWYKDSALINVTDNGDPNNVRDNSTGSGVDASSFPASFSVSQNGTSTASKTVKDNATNESSAGILQVNVDAANPTLGACPSGGPFILNSGSQLVGPIGASDSESGVDNAASTLSGSVDASSIGIKQVTFTAVDNVGHQTQKICSYSVIYKFDGFRQPVDNNGVFNVAKAGSAIPMKFSLSGNQGLNILNPNPPKVTQVVCPSSATLDTVEETVAASNSGLTYDASIDQYNYVWKTQSTFSTKCYKIDIKLDDGTSHEAYFKFTK